VSDTVELIYDPGCPNVDTARGRLRAALVVSGLPAIWREWERGVRSSPSYVQRWASPTILVNGHDVSAGDASSMALDGEAGCRVYHDTSGRLEGAPSVGTIVAALSVHHTRRSGGA
jgi:hypothetical protein